MTAETSETSKNRLIFAALLLAMAFQIILFWTCTAEDAFIVFRYARNLADGHGLVFNRDERINALTSPLHALICSGFASGTWNVESTNRFLAIALLAGLWWWVVQRVFNETRLAALSCSAFAVSPFLWFWASGGLETPFLAAAVIALWAASRSAPFATNRSSILVGLVSGLCVLLRFDAVVFVAPYLLVLIGQTLLRNEQRGGWYRIGWLIFGPLLVITWLIFAKVYYHDFLPTSYYHKTPSWHPARVKGNAIYLAQFFLFSFVWLLPVVLPINWKQAVSRRSSVLPTMAGLVCFAVYGLTTATSHMMFAYRMLVPYLPIALLGWLTMNVISDKHHEVERRAWVVRAIIVGQLLLGVYMHTVSINPGRVGEYRSVSVDDYQGFIDALERQADALDNHWNTQQKSHGPRLFTYAAGVVSFRLMDATILDGGLISYRHEFRHKLSGIRGSADYVMTLGPKHGTHEQQLGPYAATFELIDEQEINFDGAAQLRLYFQANPTRRRLSKYVDGE